MQPYHIGRPKQSLTATGLLGLSLLALLLLGCLGCDISNRLWAFLITPTPTPTNTPTATPTFTSTNTPRPTNTPTMTHTPTPSSTPLPPTRTLTPTKPPVVDLSTAILRQSDFPAGFQPLSAADLQQLKLTEADLARAFAGASTARPQNFTAFMNNNPLQIFVSFLLYPLTPLEKAALDFQLSNPDSAIKTFGAGLTTGVTGSQVSLLPEMNQFGDQSLGMAVTASSGGFTLRMDIVIVTRGNACEILLSVYPAGQQPAAKIGDMTKILDGRVAAAQGLK